MEIVLPTEPGKIERINPKRLVIYSKPKTGKTELVAGLPNNLILDLEKGSGYVSAMKLEANDLIQLANIGQAIIKAGRPYKYLTVDTVTALENMVLPLALKLYRATPRQTWV